MGVVVGARHAPRDKDEIPHKMIRQNFRGVYDWFGVIHVKRKEEEKNGYPLLDRFPYFPLTEE